MTPTIADTITENVDLPALTAQAALSSQALSSDPMCDPKEDISSDPTCDPTEKSFTQLGKRNSLPRIPRYCRQSNQATMPYNKTSSNRNVIEAGTLRVSCLDLLHKVRHIIPLFNTLHVLGLRTTLWSVIKFAQCGHTIIFGDSTIRIIMHDGRPNSFELRLSHPFYQPRDHPFGYCIQASANCVATIDPPSDATSSVVRALYARTPKIVTVELLHNRLGHVSTKAILATNEAGVWEDITVRFAPSFSVLIVRLGPLARPIEVNPRLGMPVVQARFSFVMFNRTRPKLGLPVQNWAYPSILQQELSRNCGSVFQTRHFHWH